MSTLKIVDPQKKETVSFRIMKLTETAEDRKEKLNLFRLKLDRLSRRS